MREKSVRANIGFCGDFTELFNEFTILRNMGFLKAWHRQTHIAFCKLTKTQFGSTKKTSAQRREGNQRYSKLLAGFRLDQFQDYESRANTRFGQQ